MGAFFLAFRLFWLFWWLQVRTGKRKMVSPACQWNCTLTSYWWHKWDMIQTTAPVTPTACSNALTAHHDHSIEHIIHLGRFVEMRAAQSKLAESLLSCWSLCCDWFSCSALLHHLNSHFTQYLLAVWNSPHTNTSFCAFSIKVLSV